MTTIGFAICGSFCTFKHVFREIEKLVENGYDVLPIMSENAYNFDTRFGEAKFWQDEFKRLTKKEIIHTIKDAEPIGPKKLLDALVIAPCTGNTLAKLSNGIEIFRSILLFKFRKVFGVPRTFFQKGSWRSPLSALRSPLSRSSVFNPTRWPRRSRP